MTRKYPTLALTHSELVAIAKAMREMVISFEASDESEYFAAMKANSVHYFSKFKLKVGASLFSKMSKLNVDTDLVEGAKMVQKDIAPIKCVQHARYAKHAVQFYARLLKYRGIDHKDETRIASKLQRFLRRCQLWHDEWREEHRERERRKLRQR